MLTVQGPSHLLLAAQPVKQQPLIFEHPEDHAKRRSPVQNTLSKLLHVAVAGDWTCHQWTWKRGHKRHIDSR